MPNVIAVCTIVTTVVAAFASGTSMRSAAAVMPTGSWPTSNGTVYYKEPYTVKKGQTFDGGMKTYARSNVKCTVMATAFVVAKFCSVPFKIGIECKVSPFRDSYKDRMYLDRHYGVLKYLDAYILAAAQFFYSLPKCQAASSVYDKVFIFKLPTPLTPTKLSMKLSVTSIFVAATVTSSCAGASVDNKHHENAIIFRHNTLPCTEALCKDEDAPVCSFDNKTYPNAFVGNQWVHLSASAASSSDKPPLIRCRTHPASEERGPSTASDLAKLEIVNSAFEPSKIQAAENALMNKYTRKQLVDTELHPYTYLKVLYDRSNTWDRRLVIYIKSKVLKRGKTQLPDTMGEPAKQPKVLTEGEKRIQSLIAQLPTAFKEQYTFYTPRCIMIKLVFG
ncbi:Protease inhibitor protein [Plasmopara halstedii]|uniref:Probable pectate lyase F n=1 Tax=Plasmopara halstedii TaxID=4781 RepID=A0A0P1B3Y9_PLAHL|nr:Protease inhibitor protein [Plasmopara halstedii]CEG48992.1 Protease inhibitor protein [Plasmopara halstedii]|eukprot:XP_024585361.1 Protease inhibitor protein [Plasmopara halstedii]